MRGTWRGGKGKLGASVEEWRTWPRRVAVMQTDSRRPWLHRHPRRSHHRHHNHHSHSYGLLYTPSVNINVSEPKNVTGQVWFTFVFLPIMKRLPTFASRAKLGVIATKRTARLSLWCRAEVTVCTTCLLFWFSLSQHHRQYVRKEECTEIAIILVINAVTLRENPLQRRLQSVMFSQICIIFFYVVMIWKPPNCCYNFTAVVIFPSTKLSELTTIYYSNNSHRHSQHSRHTTSVFLHGHHTVNVYVPASTGCLLRHMPAFIFTRT